MHEHSFYARRWEELECLSRIKLNENVKLEFCVIHAFHEDEAIIDDKERVFYNLLGALKPAYYAAKRAGAVVTVRWEVRAMRALEKI